MDDILNYNCINGIIQKFKKVQEQYLTKLDMLLLYLRKLGKLLSNISKSLFYSFNNIKTAVDSKNNYFNYF